MKYLGLLLVLASWVGVGFMVAKWRDKELHTISRHAASNKNAYRLFAALLMLLGVFLYWWLVSWFTPHLHLSYLFIALLTLTMICQVLTGLVPDVAGRNRLIHRWAAYAMAVLYLPLSVIIILSSQLSLPVRIFCTLLAIYMFVSFTLVVILGKARSKFLLFQASYITAFQLVILTAAYLS